MLGEELLDEVSRRIRERENVERLSDTLLARHLGVTVTALAGYRGRELTARRIANLMDSFAKAGRTAMIEQAVVPIVEFFQLRPCETTQKKSWRLFSTAPDKKPNRYLADLKQRLDTSHGIYVFHDSRGRAIYVGKAQQLTLWAEMNNAFNRDRKEVQSIKRVYHPIGRGGYAARERQIVKEAVAIHHLAAYASAYEVPDVLIGKFEALLVRAFANDLLNVRMEHF